MNFIKVFLSNWREARRLKKVAKAFSVIESQGLSVCNIQTRGNAHYLVDAAGTWHRIGR